MSTLVPLLIILAAMVGSAFFAGIETGVVAINHLRLQHLLRSGVPGATTLQYFRDHPDHLLGTTLVGNNLCNVVASVTSVSLGAHLGGSAGYTTAFITLTLVTLLFGEYLPKTWFQAAPAYRSLRFARILEWNGRLLYPFSRVMLALSRILIPFRAREEIWNTTLTREEFLQLAHDSAEKGHLSLDERFMMRKVLELPHKTCREIMTPREDFITVRDDADAAKILETARAHNKTRLPVFTPDEDRFVGVLYVFDLLGDQDTEGKTALDYLRPPQFISEKAPADDVLPRMRRSNHPLALVTDAHAKVVGLVTTEDVLEEIVGPLEG